MIHDQIIDKNNLQLRDLDVDDMSYSEDILQVKFEIITDQQRVQNGIVGQMSGIKSKLYQNFND